MKCFYFLFLLHVGFLLTACFVPPSCLSRQSGAATHRSQQFAQVIVHSKPLGEIESAESIRPGLWRHFARSRVVVIDGRGGMTVSEDDFWPERCTKISPRELAIVSQDWQRVFARQVGQRTDQQFMSQPFTGDGWKARTPILELSAGPASDKHLELLWDGRQRLPEELETAVISTLELICTHSRLAKKYLLEGLPEEVATRLDCSTP